MTDLAAAGARLGSGGEADVFTVPGRPDLAEKLYRRPSPERARKLLVMLEHPPEEARREGTVTLAWPRKLVRAPDGTVIGFRMPRIDVAASVPVFQVYNPQSRRQAAPGATWRYLLRTARNVASVVDALHRAGYVVGDLNESNLLVSREALVALVDCDSVQVPDPVTGEIHRCLVAKPEFLAPEFQGRDLSSTDRTAAGDRFALAVLVLLLVMEGVHPFAGVWRGRGEAPDLAARMRARYFPHAPLTRVAPPPAGLGMRVLPWRLRFLVWRAFVFGALVPAARPSAATWIDAIDRVDTKLRTCARSPHHTAPRHLRRCPWCVRVDRGFPDPFPGPDGVSPVVRRPPSAAARARRRMARAFRALARGAAARVGAATRRVAPASVTSLIGAGAAWTWPVTTLALALVALPVVLAAASTPAPATHGRVPGRRVWRWTRACAGLLSVGARAWGRLVAAGAATATVGATTAWAAWAAAPAAAARAAAIGLVLLLLLAPPRLTPDWAVGRRRLQGRRQPSATSM